MATRTRYGRRKDEWSASSTASTLPESLRRRILCSDRSARKIGTNSHVTRVLLICKIRTLAVGQAAQLVHAASLQTGNKALWRRSRSPTKSPSCMHSRCRNPQILQKPSRRVFRTGLSLAVSLRCEAGGLRGDRVSDSCLAVRPLQSPRMMETLQVPISYSKATCFDNVSRASQTYPQPSFDRSP